MSLLLLCRRALTGESSRLVSAINYATSTRSFASQVTGLNEAKKQDEPLASSTRFASFSTQSEIEKTPLTGRLLDQFGPTPSGSAAAEASGETTDSPIGVAEDSTRDVVKLILLAVENCKPLMKVTGVKSGTKINYIPKFVTPGESRSLAIRWIVEATHKRRAQTKAKISECLALELLLASKKEGQARQKRDDIHKLALENKGNIGGAVRAGKKKK
eukprot:gene19465-26126_t